MAAQHGMRPCEKLIVQQQGSDKGQTRAVVILHHALTGPCLFVQRNHCLEQSSCMQFQPIGTATNLTAACWLLERQASELLSQHLNCPLRAPAEA